MKNNVKEIEKKMSALCKELAAKSMPSRNVAEIKNKKVYGL